MHQAPFADEGVITDITFDVGGSSRIHLSNGNAYKVSRTINQDIFNPVFRGVTVRLLLTEHHRVFDISVI